MFWEDSYDLTRGGVLLFGAIEICLFSKLFHSGRWRNTNDQTVHGPYSSSELLSWVNAGFISDAIPIDLREVRQPLERTSDGFGTILKSLCPKRPCCEEMHPLLSRADHLLFWASLGGETHAAG